MTLEIEVRSSGPGPRQREVWTQPAGHGIFWIRAALLFQRENWPRDGVAVIIRRVP